MKTSSKFLDLGLAQTTPFPFELEIEKAEGIFLYSTDGKRYMDLISGVGVSSIGHGNPKVIDAIKTQAEKHLHVMVYGEYLQAPQTALAKRLTGLLPEQLNSCYFVNSGAEAIEAALKLAKRSTNRTRLVSCRGSYHGSTHGAMSVSGNEVKKQRFRPLLPDVHFMRFNTIEDLDVITEETACVLLETVQGDAGIRIPDLSWLLAVRKKCDETGALLILDEIQAGLGRTGKMFAFEHYGITPDILVLGKALGGGLPIGAIVANRSLMENFTSDPMLGHITTFGGHPLICAAAEAGLDVLESEIDLVQSVKLSKKIASSLSSHAKVKEVRHIGMYFAIDLGSPEEVQIVVEKGLELGIIGFWFLSCPWSFRIAPPLTMSEAECDEAIQLMIEALNALP